MLLWRPVPRWQVLFLGCEHGRKQVIKKRVRLVDLRPEIFSIQYINEGFQESTLWLKVSATFKPKTSGTKYFGGNNWRLRNKIDKMKYLISFSRATVRSKRSTNRFVWEKNVLKCPEGEIFFYGRLLSNVWGKEGGGGRKRQVRKAKRHSRSTLQV